MMPDIIVAIRNTHTHSTVDNWSIFYMRITTGQGWIIHLILYVHTHICKYISEEDMHIVSC